MAVLLRFAEHRMPEKPLEDGFRYSAGDVMLHLGGSEEGAIPRVWNIPRGGHNWPIVMPARGLTLAESGH